MILKVDCWLLKADFHFLLSSTVDRLPVLWFLLLSLLFCKTIVDVLVIVVVISFVLNIENPLLMRSA